MEYITIKEASEKWGVSVSRIGILVNEGRIPGAKHFGRNWLIPANAVKPPERKGGRSGSSVKEQETSCFSFPLFHLRPDWSDAQVSQLSPQQHSLLLAENAFLECRYEDAYPLLEAILSAPDDIYTEIGALWNVGMCCIAQNKPEDFSRFFLRLKLLLAKDFPHRDKLRVILDELATYAETMLSMANRNACSTELHPQVLPMICVLRGYAQLTKETVMLGSAEAPLLEVALCFLESTTAAFAAEMLHLYLLGIYSFRKDTAAAEKHAKAVVQIAYESKVYFPLVSYYHYNIPIFSPILDQYPPEFQAFCREQSSRYEKNYTSFCAFIGENSVLSKLTEADYPYVFAVLMGLTNTRIAEEVGVAMPTVSRKLEKLCNTFGVKGKKELKAYLLKFL